MIGVKLGSVKGIFHKLKAENKIKCSFEDFRIRDYLEDKKTFLNLDTEEDYFFNLNYKAGLEYVDMLDTETKAAFETRIKKEIKRVFGKDFEKISII